MKKENEKSALPGALSPGTGPDRLDMLQAEWAREMPSLDTGSMGIVGRLILLGSALKESASHALLRHDLMYTDFDIIATLRRAGAPYALTPTALSGAVLLTSGAMTAALKRLEARDLITRSQAAGDGRVRLVSLTPKGCKLAEDAALTRFHDADTALASLSQDDRAALEPLLRTLCHLLSPGD